MAVIRTQVIAEPVEVNRALKLVRCTELIREEAEQILEVTSRAGRILEEELPNGAQCVGRKRGSKDGSVDQGGGGS